MDIYTTFILFILLIILVLNLKNYIEKNKNSIIKESFLKDLEENLQRMEKSIKDELLRGRTENSGHFSENRKELSSSFKSLEDSILKRMNETVIFQKSQFATFLDQTEKLTQSNEKKLDRMTATIEEKLTGIQKDNNEKLEKMRETVDEKLHKTLEDRLGQSFKIVSERLDIVSKGLGEMQVLASGVGDLKKVLANVKTRGILGEYQLGNILEQMLAPSQYSKNVKLDVNSDNQIEFAIKLPGRENKEDCIWLPIDAKFPITTYQYLIEAREKINPEEIKETRKQFFRNVRNSAQEIRDKYINPPYTTDFAIMFLPIEGLYAEVIRNTELFEELQKKFKVIVTGPTTLSAILSSLQMGFKTLAIEKRSSEVWELLSAVKTEFGNFGAILDKTKKKLNEATNAIDQAGVRTRAIHRRLRNVEDLPEITGEDK
jgi:DNA recombination protein RmuC